VYFETDDRFVLTVYFGRDPATEAGRQTAIVLRLMWYPDINKTGIPKDPGLKTSRLSRELLNASHYQSNVDCLSARISPGVGGGDIEEIVTE
jgi:hypothetical protein